jgi:hypothetical protein
MCQSIRVYEAKLISEKGIERNFIFSADNKDLANDHVFHTLANDDAFTGSLGHPVEGSVKFIGHSPDGLCQHVERLYS